MASFSGPKLSNRIADDVPDIQALLSSLAKLTPDSGNTDYPTGTKRVAETASGYEIQQFNGSSWVTLDKWNIDVQKVDGYSASTGTTASTIPVRDTDGKISGDITGNASTASTAAALSVTNSIDKGGTGATTAEQARANLGVPPTSHASTGTSYGVSTADNYGHAKASSTTPTALGTAYVGAETTSFARGDHVHPAITATDDELGMVKLSDSTASSSSTDGGVAATPAAVKTAYDLADLANNAANGKVNRGGDTMTGTLNAPELHAKQPNVVKGTNPSSTQYAAYHFVDSTGEPNTAHRLGTVEYSVKSDGTAQIIIGPYLFKELTSFTGNLLTVGIYNDGTGYTNASNLTVSGFLKIPGGQIWIA